MNIKIRWHKIYAEQIVQKDLSSRNSLINVDLFFQKINRLNSQHGAINVERALKLLKINETNFAKKNYSFDCLEQIVKDIKKIESNSRWQTFQFDAAKGGTVSYNSINEAIAGIACEEQKLLQVPLIRSTGLAEEFIDPLMQAWDVKTPPSFAPDGRKIFNEVEVIKSIKTELLGKENIILNISFLEKK